MTKFKQRDDDFIVRYFQAVGAEHLALYDLPYTAQQITERYEYLLKNKPHLFQEALREDRIWEAYIKYDLTESMIAILSDLLIGKNPSRRGASMSLKGLTARGMIDSDKKLTKLGQEISELFREDILQ